MHALRLHQRRDQRHRIVRKRRRAHRIVAVARTIAAGETAEARRLRRGEPAAFKRSVRHDARIVPQTGAEQLNALGVDAVLRQRLHHLRHGVGAVGDEDVVDAAGSLRDAARRFGHTRGILRIFFQHDDAAAAARNFLLQRGFDHRAIGIVGQHRRERAFAARGRVIDDAPHVGLRQETQEIDAARRDAGVGRERDHRNVAGARHGADGANRLRKQRTDDQLGAFVERLLSRELRALRRTGVILHEQLDVGIFEFVERHFGGVLHRLRGDAGIALRRQRQDQPDANLAAADIIAGLRRRFGRLARKDVAAGRASGTGARRQSHGECGNRKGIADAAQRARQLAPLGRFLRYSRQRPLPTRQRISPSDNQPFCPAKVKVMKR